MMVGVEAAACCIPYRRLSLQVIRGGRNDATGGPERAVAWFDEDSITMAVEAARQCLAYAQWPDIDGLILASTSSPYDEKQGASIVARALNLPGYVSTMDVAQSLRAGTTAIRFAMAAVKSGEMKKVLVLASDERAVAPGSAGEIDLGDGAVALLIGADDVKLALSESRSTNNEMMDVWRRSGDRYLHGWEDRFIKKHGYQHVLVSAVREFCEAYCCEVGEFSRVCLYAPDPRSHQSVVAELNVARECVQDPFFGRVGNIGVGAALLQLVAAFESSNVGDRILLASYGDGADVLAFELVSAPPSRGTVPRALEHRKPVSRYQDFLSAKGLQHREYAEADYQGISATVQYRNAKENLGLVGQRCNNCDTHQFPRGRVCGQCGEKDSWEEVCYSRDLATLLTYTKDAFFPAPEPPTLAGIVEVERHSVGGGKSRGPRMHIQVTECDKDALRCGMQLKFVFRCIHRAGKRPNYFWKCVPIEERESQAV